MQTLRQLEQYQCVPSTVSPELVFLPDSGELSFNARTLMLNSTF